MNKILSYLLLGVLIFDQINGQSFFLAKLREIKKNKDVQGTATSAKRVSLAASTRPSGSSPNPSRRFLASRPGATSVDRITSTNLEKHEVKNEKSKKEPARISPFANRSLKRLQSLHTVLHTDDDKNQASLTKEQPSKIANKKSYTHRFGGREKSSALKRNSKSSYKSSKNVPTSTQNPAAKLPKTEEFSFKSSNFNGNNFKSFSTEGTTSFHRFSSNSFSANSFDSKSFATNSFGSKSFSAPSFPSSSKSSEEIVTATAGEESKVSKDSLVSKARSTTTTSTTLETSTTKPTVDTSTVMPTFDYSTEKATFDVSTIKTTLVTYSSISDTLSTLITVASTPKPTTEFSSSTFEDSSTTSSSTKFADSSTSTKLSDSSNDLLSTDFSTTPLTTSSPSSTESIFEADVQTSKKRLQKKEETEKSGNIYGKFGKFDNSFSF